jgi:hypothetical protein
MQAGQCGNHEVRALEVKGEPPNQRNVEVEEVFFLEE